jgi:hypothetical protein
MHHTTRTYTHEHAHVCTRTRPMSRAQLTAKSDNKQSSTRPACVHAHSTHVCMHASMHSNSTEASGSTPYLVAVLQTSDDLSLDARTSATNRIATSMESKVSVVCIQASAYVCVCVLHVYSHTNMHATKLKYKQTTLKMSFPTTSRAHTRLHTHARTHARTHAHM